MWKTTHFGSTAADFRAIRESPLRHTLSILMVTTSMLQIKAVRDDLVDLKESVQEMQTEEGVENNALRINGK